MLALGHFRNIDEPMFHLHEIHYLCLSEGRKEDMGELTPADHHR